ncbi:MAG: tetratricopeptide repeat protein [Tepidisphaeraceae bacterium]
MAELTTTAKPPIWRGTPLVLALLCGLAAYSNSFRGPFIFDDIDAIRNNPRSDAPTTLSGRPVLRVSFAVDRAIGGLRVEAYHATNLLIHLAGGAVLFGIVRRNLQRREFWGDRFQNSAPWLAGAVAAVWLVHPLNTEAVSYIVQRAESLAGLFYLLVIYCLIRDWKLAAIAACLLGMGTKETVATAPLVALVYDRTFISRSFATAWKTRWPLYLGLAVTWVIPLGVIASGARGLSVGNVPPVDYVLTQLGVMAHYVALEVWPGRLVLDYYDWPIAHGWSQVGVGGRVVALSILFFAVALWWKPWLGFLGAWFFIILAPSSSVVPVFTEIAAEHRMYLPSMALVVLAVVGGWIMLSRGVGGGEACRAGAWVAGLLVTVVVGLLATRTFLRNAEYENPELIWSDNVALRPLNPRAHFNLGFTRMEMGRPAQAVGEFRKALELEPDYYAAASALGHALIESGDPVAAEDFYTREMARLPAFWQEAHLERGRLRTARGDSAGAQADFQAVRHPSEPSQ